VGDDGANGDRHPDQPNPRNTRTRSGKQRRAPAKSILSVGFTAPLPVDENNILLAGHVQLYRASSPAAAGNSLVPPAFSSPSHRP
jgi:hypothetical protein